MIRTIFTSPKYLWQNKIIKMNQIPKQESNTTRGSIKQIQYNNDQIWQKKYPNRKTSTLGKVYASLIPVNGRKKKLEIQVKILVSSSKIQLNSRKASMNLATTGGPSILISIVSIRALVLDWQISYFMAKNENNENCNMCRKDIYYCGSNTNLYKYTKDTKKRTSYKHRFMFLPEDA